MSLKISVEFSPAGESVTFRFYDCGSACAPRKPKGAVMRSSFFVLLMRRAWQQARLLFISPLLAAARRVERGGRSLKRAQARIKFKYKLPVFVCGKEKAAVPAFFFVIDSPIRRAF